MTIPPDTGLAAAGWYADPPGSTTMRWWDGTRWTEQTHDTAVQPYTTQPHAQPYSMAQALPAVPAGTPVYNGYIWAIVLLPLVTLLPLFMIDLESFVVASLDTTNPLAQYSDPGYLLLNVLGFVVYAVTVLLAFLDWRKLKSDGFAAPFHWAFAFIPYQIVYIIGRSVVARRRAGSGLAPIWAYIGVIVLSTIIGILWVVMLFSTMMESMPGLYY